MSFKAKGINAERELIHMFWNSEWSACRIAGSGSSKYPSPDIVAGNNTRKLAIESKVTKGSVKYLTKKEIAELQLFSVKFGAEPWIAVKFKGNPWFFLSLEDLQESNKSHSISLEKAKLKGLSFNELIEIF